MAKSQFDALPQLKQAVKVHESGQLKAASELYKEILDTDPNNADALHLLGVSQLQQGEVNDAIEYINRAIKISPDHASFYTNLATAYKNNGEINIAIQHFKKAIELDPNMFEAHNNIGQTYLASNDYNQAQMHYETALLIKENSPDTFNNLGKCYLKQKEYERALSCFRHAISILPKYASAYNNCGEALYALGKKEKAYEYFEKSLKIKPEYDQAHINLAKMHFANQDLEEAISHLEAAIKFSPNCTEAYIELGKLFQSQGMVDAACESFKKALNINANCSQAHKLFAISQSEIGEYDIAISHLNQSIELEPNVENYYLLAKIYAQTNHISKTVDYLKKALNIDPMHVKSNLLLSKILIDSNQFPEALTALNCILLDSPNHTEALSLKAFIYLNLSNLKEIELIKQTLKSSISESLIAKKPLNIAPYIGLALELPMLIQQKTCNDFAKNFNNVQLKHQFRQYSPAKEKIKIGYISANFADEEIGILIRNLFSYHNKNEFEIFAYNLLPADGPYKNKIKESVDHFKEIRNINLFEAAKEIHDDGINILIDLCGYSKHARPGILALKPAPVQCHMLGYPSTMGAQFMDYYISNEIIVPATIQKYFNESIVYLPNTAFSTLPFSKEECTTTREEVGLPTDKFIFCCLCENYRITPELFTTWLNILKSCENSVLWLLSTNQEAEFNLKHFAAQKGICSDRLIFSCDKNIRNSFKTDLADLWLDSFSLSSTTNAIIALWAGLPFITLASEPPHARVATSYLHAANAPELVVDSLNSYEKSAIGLYNNSKRLNEIKNKLLQERYKSALFHPEQYIKNLETAFKSMWNNYNDSEKPKVIQITDSNFTK